MNFKRISQQQLESLTVLQFQTESANTFEYKASSQALREGLIQIREVDQHGSVNNLLVENLSKFFIFITDGDVLAGAKQNRVLNVSVLLRPESKTVVPVSCVEAGRWKSVSQNFSSTDHIAPASLREFKSRILAKKVNTQDFMADQGGVWNHVASMKTTSGAHAPTNNLSDVFEHKKNALDKALSSAKPAEGANGVAVFHGDTLVSLDVFNRTDVYSEVFPRLVRGVLLDTLSRPSKSPINSLPDAEQIVHSLFAKSGTGGSSRPSIGVGTERRFEFPDLVGFELEFDKHPIHLCLLGKTRG